MMHPFFHADLAPQQIAVIDGDTGQTLTYQELAAEAHRWGSELIDRGVEAGNRVALMLPNMLEYFGVAWGLQSIGVEYTPINSHLTATEVARIIVHSGATTLISSAELLPVVSELGEVADAQLRQRYLVDGAAEGWTAWPEHRVSLEGRKIEGAREGMFLYYSSGSTGSPKGILRGELVERHIGESPDQLTLDFLRLVDFQEGDQLLSSAPLYHSAPLGWAMGVHRVGGAVIFTRKFDAEQTLHLIEKHKISHAHMVPTMFVRILKLPVDVRTSFDRSSVKAIVHSAAPCPIHVKQKMIQEWGDVIFEYYTSTELIGATFINTRDWLAHTGSVGRALPAWGIPHIIDEDRRDVPAGEEGELWFEGEFPFTYFGDTSALLSQRDEERGWATAGDIGRMDGDGFIYLTDRKAFMIVSGGVNIYPQEIEAALILHPLVADVAVFGVPNPDFGEEVKAAIELASGVERTAAVEAELDAYARRELASYKAPRSYDFHDALPRLDTGKLYKRALRDPYWNSAEGSR